MPTKDREPKRKGRKPEISRFEFKSLPVDSQAPGFFHPSVADVLASNGVSMGTAKRYAHVRRMVLSGLARRQREVN